MAPRWDDTKCERRSVATVRQYLKALGALLELVAVLDDEGRRVSIQLRKDTAA